MSLIFENKVPVAYRTAFVQKVMAVSNNLGINPNWLMAIINWESAGTFSPAITNSIGATGLIQFMPKTAISLGTTTAQLKQMTAVQQLDYVYKYYAPYKSKIKGYVDMYLATLFPLALGKPLDFVLQSSTISAQAIASANPAFDLNHDSKITVGEISERMLYQIPKDWLDNFVSEKKR